jgi:hypothetical protein
MTCFAYYTIDTPYEKEAQSLKQSLKALKIPYLLCGIRDQGDWQKNTQAKAVVFSEIVHTYDRFKLLYLDVDAIMVQHPVALENIQADIAAVHFAGGSELLSGTVLFGNTSVCKDVVRRWMEINAQHPINLPDGRAAWDQRTLEMAIKENASCRFVELPQEYTWITELTQKHRPGLAPVIMHTRGAYRFKRIINRGRHA